MLVKLIVFQDPWNKCTFVCKICHVTFHDRMVISNHISRKHQMNFTTYKEIHGNPVVSCPKVRFLDIIFKYKHKRLLLVELHAV